MKVQSSNSTLVTKRLKQGLVHWLATGLGSGLIPWMPGTWGTLVAVLIYSLYLAYLPLLHYVVLVSFLTGIAIIVSGSESRYLGEHDASSIVIDEIVGFWWSMLLIPATLWWIMAGFILFRFFDIVKPWPISYLDRSIKGGLGIVLDDLMAAVYTCWVLHIIYAFICSQLLNDIF